MGNKITIKESNYTLTDLKRPVVFEDTHGRQYRVSFGEDGGLVVNKLGTDTDQIVVFPRVTNEVFLK